MDQALLRKAELLRADPTRMGSISWRNSKSTLMQMTRCLLIMSWRCSSIHTYIHARGDGLCWSFKLQLINECVLIQGNVRLCKRMCGFKRQCVLISTTNEMSADCIDEYDCVHFVCHCQVCVQSFSLLDQYNDFRLFVRRCYIVRSVMRITSGAKHLQSDSKFSGSSPIFKNGVSNVFNRQSLA